MAADGISGPFHHAAIVSRSSTSLSDLIGNAMDDISGQIAVGILEMGALSYEESGGLNLLRHLPKVCL